MEWLDCDGCTSRVIVLRDCLAQTFHALLQQHIVLVSVYIVDSSNAIEVSEYDGRNQDSW